MRRLVWIKTARTQAWGCSECGWTFQPEGPPLGDSLDEMMQEYEGRRDKEWALHLCIPGAIREEARTVARLRLSLTIDQMALVRTLNADVKR